MTDRRKIVIATGNAGKLREYRELLNGEITADEYVKKLKEEVDEFLERERGE